MFFFRPFLGFGRTDSFVFLFPGVLPSIGENGNPPFDIFAKNLSYLDSLKVFPNDFVQAKFLSRERASSVAFFQLSLKFSFGTPFPSF